MAMYPILKSVHAGLAILTVSGFVLRGTWMFRRSVKLDRPLVRIAPHVIDTAFLITGIWLVAILRLSVIQQGWLLAKFAALIAYIVLGAVALRYGRTMRTRTAAFVVALTTYLYIAGVALNKTAISWFAFF
jgi:uncharacterized membrane protein SirB2